MIKVNPLITSNNLSLAWTEAFLASIEPGIEEISPSTIVVTEFDDGIPVEISEIRNALDRTLLDCGMFETNATANTIFPVSLWNPQKEPDVMYQRYQKIAPGLKKADHHNRYGVYFERLIDYGKGHQNQLDFIIRAYKSGNHRRSALQAAIFDPLLDQRNQRLRGFPCLQQVAFIPYPVSKELAIHGFYATQYLFERAYGNILGLARLGNFMAKQLGLRLSRVSCTASVAKYGTPPRAELHFLTEFLRDKFDQADKEN